MAVRRQTRFAFKTWGGKRKGAGRKPAGAEAGMSHRGRPVLKRRFPVHVTWRVTDEVWNLRSRRCFNVLHRAFMRGANRFGFRLVQYAVMGNHLHFVVEAEDARSLSRGMQGLGVRVAFRLNQLMRRGGRVLSDRYHAHILKTPTEVKRAITYLRTNAAKHYRYDGRDPFTSQTPFLRPRTWLLQRQLE
jgi:REP element-mobilizing transposase RayT